MTLQLSIKRSLVAAIAVTMLFSLSACAKSSQSGTSSSSSVSSTSNRSNQQKVAKLFKKAQRQIENGQNDEALTTLKRAQRLDSDNAKVNELLANVQNYLSAKAALNEGDTSTAQSNLSKMTSEQTKNNALTSQAKDLNTQASQLKQANTLYQSAYDAVSNGYYETAKAKLAQLNALPSTVKAIKSLQDQGKALTNQINANQNSSSTSQNASSNATNSSSSASTGRLSDDQNDSIIQSFQSAAGITAQTGMSFGVSQIGTNEYQIEVRQSNSTNTVGSLTGIYRYNSQTGSVSKLNTISGKYESN